MRGRTGTAYVLLTNDDIGVDILMMQDENGFVDDTGMHGTKIAAKMLHQLRLESGIR